jgi:hypothetical protein
MNLIQLSQHGKNFNVYFSNDLSKLEVVDGSYRDGRRLTLSPEDKVAICDIISQEVYLSLQDYDLFKDSKAVRA